MSSLCYIQRFDAAFQELQHLSFQSYDLDPRVTWLAIPGDMLFPGEDIINLTIRGQCEDRNNLSILRVELYLDRSKSKSVGSHLL